VRVASYGGGSAQDVLSGSNKPKHTKGDRARRKTKIGARPQGPDAREGLRKTTGYDFVLVGLLTQTTVTPRCLAQFSTVAILL
jgi:hypothetical protein